MVVHVINPDAIHEGDQVTLTQMGGDPVAWTVYQRVGATLKVEKDGDFRTFRLGGSRTLYQIVGHQPRLV